MIKYVTGDLLAADSEALVNSINCVGVMGRGVALAFKRRFPGNFRAYRAACDCGDLQPGRMFVFETGELMPRSKGTGFIRSPCRRSGADSAVSSGPR